MEAGTFASTLEALAAAAAAAAAAAMNHKIIGPTPGAAGDAKTGPDEKEESRAKN